MGIITLSTSMSIIFDFDVIIIASYSNVRDGLDLREYVCDSGSKAAACHFREERVVLFSWPIICQNSILVCFAKKKSVKIKKSKGKR